MRTTRVRELDVLEELDEAAQPKKGVSPAPTRYLQHVADDWEETAVGPRAESACTAAVREWEERNR